MAKKILGNDPFSANKESAAQKAKKPNGKPAQKTKRAPSRKTEAPLIAAPRTSTPVAKKKTKPVEKKANVSGVLKEAVAKMAALESVQAPVIVETPPVTATALAPRPVQTFDEPPADANPGSWRWWRYRQVQLARSEEAAWLAHSDHQTGVRADRFGRDSVLAGRAEPIVDVLYRSWLRVSVRGLGHVPESGRAILVVRRRRPQVAGLTGAAFERLSRLGLDGSFGTALDAAIISHAIRTEHVAHREVRPLIRQSRLYTPIVGSLLRRLGGVPADLHDFARLLDDDRLALAFVDDHGTTRRHDVLDLTTIISLALVTGAPIVPVVVGKGPSATLRERFGSLRGRPSVTAIAFGTPLFPGAEFGPEGAEDEVLVKRLTDELSTQLG